MVINEVVADFEGIRTYELWEIPLQRRVWIQLGYPSTRFSPQGLTNAERVTLYGISHY